MKATPSKGKYTDKHIEQLAKNFVHLLRRIEFLEEGFICMANDFTALSAAIDRAVMLINEAVTILQNPQTNNNDQSVIDALTIRLTGAADALAGAEAPVEPTPAPAPEEAPAGDTTATDAPAE